MALKEVTSEVTKKITICDICEQKYRGTWLHIFANSISTGPRGLVGRFRWFLEVVTRDYQKRYDICDDCVIEMIQTKLKEKNDEQ